MSVSEVLLVSADRYFCLGCPCPASAGLPFRPSTTAAAATATAQGLVALPGRDDLLALTVPDPTEHHRSAAALAAEDDERDLDRDLAHLSVCLAVASRRERVPTEHAAALAAALRTTAVRDAAWQATTGVMWQRDLWLDLTRRLPDAYVTAPASLAAWCCWLRGEDVLALAAAQRALTATPGYRMAAIVESAVHAHIPAHRVIDMWPPSTPLPQGNPA
jgi:hypothetical protein